jgi:hypothetical protein
VWRVSKLLIYAPLGWRNEAPQKTKEIHWTFSIASC